MASLQVAAGKRAETIIKTQKTAAGKPGFATKIGSF